MTRRHGSRAAAWALTLLLALGTLSGCEKEAGAAALTGTPPRVEMDGFALTVSQTPLQEVLDAGFEKVPRLGFAGESIAPHSFSSDLYYLGRPGEDGQLVEYAGVGLVNDSAAAKETAACTVCSVYWQLAVGGEELPGGLLVNGVDFRGLAAEDVRETLAGMEVLRDQGGSLSLQDGSFTYQFSFNLDGNIESLEIYTTYPTR